MRSIFLVLVQLVVISPAVIHADEPRSVLDYRQRDGMNVNVPKQPLSRQDVERWARIINASDEQHAFMAVMYEQFVKRHNEFLDREAPKYMTLSAQLADVYKTDGGDAVSTYELRKKMDQANARMRRELIAIEDVFIDSLESGLTEAQIERVALLRDESKRRNHRTFFTIGRWREVELRQLWERIGADDATPEERDHVESLLADYERRLTTIVCRQSDYEYEARRKLADNRMARQAGTIAASDSETAYRRIMGKRRELAQRVRLLHEQTMRNIGAVLNQLMASRFRQAALELAYPEIYPDPAAIHAVFAAVIHDPSLDQTMLPSLNAVLEEYQFTYLRLCQEMESLCNEWAENTEGGITGFEPQFLNEALTPWQEKRNEVSAKYLKTLQELVGEDLVAEHKSRVMPPAMVEPFEVMLDGASSKP